MAQVPYQPFSTERPDMEGTPQIRLNVPPQAFGVGVAQAVEGLGGSLEKVADQYVNTSMEFKRLDLEANVNKAVTGYLNETGDLDNQFRLMEGNTPQNNLMRHQKALTDIRESYRAGLGTDYERKLFDNQSMRRLSYDIVNAGNYAATQFKQYSKQSYKALQLSMAERDARDPYNDRVIEQSEQSIEDAEKGAIGTDGAYDPKDPVQAMQVKQAVGSYVKHVVAARARDSRPDSIDAAKSLLEKYKDKMSYADYLDGKNIIDDKAVKYYATINSRAAFAGRLPAGHVVTQAAPFIRQVAESRGWETFTPENIYKLTRQEAPGGNEPPNKYGYAGYFQMKPEEFGLTPADFAKMSFGQQLQLYMDKYLPSHGYTGKEDLGVMNAAPAFRNAPDTQVAYAAGSAQANANPQWVQYSQAGGAVTVGGIKAWMQAGGKGLPTTPEADLPQMIQRGYEDAARLFPNDEKRQADYIDDYTSKIKRNASLERTMLNDKINTYRTAIDKALITPTSPGGRKPTSDEEATAVNPNFKQILDEAVVLRPSLADHVRKTYENNAKEDVPETDERRRMYHQLWGMSKLDPQSFVELNLSDYDMTHKQRDKLGDEQIKQRAKPEVDPHVRSAVADVSKLLNENGIYATDAKLWNQFGGAFASKLYEYRDNNKGKFPDWNEKQRMASTLLQSDEEGILASIFGGRKRFEVPSDFPPKNVLDEFRAKRGEEPSSMDIYRMYQLERARKDKANR